MKKNREITTKKCDFVDKSSISLKYKFFRKISIT